MQINTLKHSLPFITSALLAGCGDSVQEKQTNESSVQKPNILFVMADDHAQKAISAYNKTLIETPNIDRIAQEGAIFTNSFVANSISAPSRAVMLTGKHSHLNGQLDNQCRFDSSQFTFPKLLQKNGYYTVMAGKWHLKSAPTGFDQWKIINDQGDYYNPDFISGRDTVQLHGYVTDLITDVAIKMLEERDKTKPFCLLYHHKAPHRSWMPDTTDLYCFEDTKFPLPANFHDDYKGRIAAEQADMRIRDMFFSGDMKMRPGQYMKESEKGGSGPRKFDGIEEIAQKWLDRMDTAQRQAWDNYYMPRNDSVAKLNLKGKALAEWMYQRYLHDYLKCIISVDRNLGRILNYLKNNNLLDNTMIVYTSDQGFYLGEHGWYDKRFMYEESFRTPLLIRYPKEIKKGTVIDQLVQNIDYAPTFLDLAGIPIPEDVQGKSLRPLWAVENINWRSALYYHYYEYPHGWHFANKHEGIRTKRYKLIYFYQLNHWEFYDLKTDSLEMNNLYGNKQFQPKIDSLKKELVKLKKHYKVN